MNCQKVSHLLSAYMDSELNGTEMLQVRAHIHNCESCEMELDRLREGKRLLSAMRAREPRVGLESAIIAQARLERDTFGAPAHSLRHGYTIALAHPRALAMAMAGAMLLVTLLWPVGRNVSGEASAMDANSYIAEHSAYQSYQPLSGGASIDLASTDARVRLAGSEE